MPNKLLEQAAEFGRAALSFFYPEICQVCKENRAVASEGFVCRSCAGKVELVEPPWCECCGRPYEGAISTAFRCHHCLEAAPTFSFARSAAVAHDQLREVIHQYKYARALWFEPFLVGLLADRAVPVLKAQKWDLIVPVPLHPTKQREREFNQAERLANGLSLEANIPVANGLLQRVQPTRTQTQLTREERRKNVRKAFEFSGNERLAGCNVIVIDDVFTTGATTNACARVLKAAGAGEVCVWTVARGT